MPFARKLSKILSGKARTSLFLLSVKLYHIVSLVQTTRTNNLVSCNICGWSGKFYEAFYNIRTRKKEQSMCPNCKSLYRQRGIYDYLVLHYAKEANWNILEVSPHSSNPAGRALPYSTYTSVDIIPERAMKQMDLTNLKFVDNTFDILVCTAVLEEISNDALAIKEIHRVLKPFGKAILWVPHGFYGNPSGLNTIEFKQKKFYGDDGHVRNYGLDFYHKLSSYGFNVERFSIGNKECLYIGAKREA